MTLDFLITIDPVKPISLLNIIIHSLNLQTNKNFHVVFYNQTLHSERDLLSSLPIQPRFPYKFFSIKRNCFLGKYPVWDLYGFHNFLLDQNILHDYSMSLHMEEFLDVDYVESALTVLEEFGMDILFGNLSRTQLLYEDIYPILGTKNSRQFDQFLQYRQAKTAYHWIFPYNPLFLTRSIFSKNVMRRNFLKFRHFGFRKSLKATPSGYTKLAARYEDVHFMKKEFAERHNWFLRGHPMYFHDIHISEIEGVCELSHELQKITQFPLHLNLSKVYHINHGKFYFQFEDEEFATLMLKHQTDDPILNNLQKAINMYRNRQLTLADALKYTRQNTDGTGIQNLDFLYHMKYLQNGDLKKEYAFLTS